jgi:hypothetical protein
MGKGNHFTFEITRDHTHLEEAKSLSNRKADMVNIPRSYIGVDKAINIYLTLPFSIT